MDALRPASVAELQDILADAAARRAALDVRAGGSKVSLGRMVENAQVLDASALSGIVAYDPAELVLTAKAATPLATVEAALAEQGQHLAFEPPDYAALLGTSGAPTLGGTLAANLSGPRRIAAGASRDHFLGVHAVSGRGEAFKSGGKVVKNVTGYDLAKLLAGSFGTLAVMTEVSVKVLPAPEDVATVVVAGLSDAAAVQLLTRVTGLPVDATGLAHLPMAAAARSAVQAVAGADAPLTVVRFEGIAASVRARVATLRESLTGAVAGAGEFSLLDHPQSTALWREIRDGLLLPRAGVVWRLSVPPAVGADVAARIAAATPSEVLFDWAGGLLWVTLATALSQQTPVRGAIGATGGHATLVRAAAAERQGAAVFEPLPAALAALTRRVKESFDPSGILSPGRMYA